MILNWILYSDRELLENRAIFAEHMAPSPLLHSHGNVPPIPSAISSASENVDDPIFNLHKNDQSGQNDLYNILLAANVQDRSISTQLKNVKKP